MLKQKGFVITSSCGYIGGSTQVVFESSDFLAVNDGGVGG